MELAVGTLVGILIGVYCATPLKALLNWMDEQHPGVVSFVWLGAILAYMSAAMQWLGFAVVVTTFLLFHAIKGGGLKFLVAKRPRPTVSDDGEIVPPKSNGKAGSSKAASSKAA